MPTRRQFLAAAGALAAGSAAFGAWTWGVAPYRLELTRRPLRVAGLPGRLHGRTVVHLSDLHVGGVPERYLIRTLQRVAALRPDFVVCTGDWITWRGPEDLERLRAVLTHMPRGNLATVGVLGNHDYGVGWQMEDVADEVTRLAAEAGVDMLRNEALEVEGITFLGLDDLWGPRFDPAPLLTSARGRPATITLCHNPDTADRPVWNGWQGWILAGHTHGGQVKPPFLPPPVLPVENPRYVAGEVDLRDGRRLYISRGVGHWLRVRFNVRPEVAVFRLRSAERIGGQSA